MSSTPHQTSCLRRGEQGVALLITVVLLLMVSAIGLSALNKAGDERFQQRSSTRKTATLAAAEAGVSLVRDQLDQAAGMNMAVLNPLAPGTLQDPARPIDQQQLFQDEYGLWTGVRTGTVDSAVAQPIEKKRSRPKEGDMLNIGAQGRRDWRIYRASVVATDPGQGNAQVQAQFRVLEQGTY